MRSMRAACIETRADDAANRLRMKGTGDPSGAQTLPVDEAEAALR